jgi:hypothetical protein
VAFGKDGGLRRLAQVDCEKFHKQGRMVGEIPLDLVADWFILILDECDISALLCCGLRDLCRESALLLCFFP